MKEPTTGDQNQLLKCDSSCPWLCGGHDPEYEARLELGHRKDAFYRELGWSADEQADFFFETVSLTKLSIDEWLLLWKMRAEI
jgi:hypothetical protein